jgi:hypothetical protein
VSIRRGLAVAKKGGWYKLESVPWRFTLPPLSDHPSSQHISVLSLSLQWLEPSSTRVAVFYDLLSQKKNLVTGLFVLDTIMFLALADVMGLFKYDVTQFWKRVESSIYDFNKFLKYNSSLHLVLFFIRSFYLFWKFGLFLYFF